VSATVYLVRHGEVAHHRTDISLTARGQEQARLAGSALARQMADGDTVCVHYSPVTRVRETADILYASLAAALRAGNFSRVVLHPPQPDPALHNVRFILEPGQQPEEPSLLYTQSNDPAYLQTRPPAQADFYRGFWASADHIGYWLSHDSGGGAETPTTVLARVRARLGEISALDGSHPTQTHWLMITHSGTMRTVLCEALGTDPGEPDFCETVILRPAAQAGRVTLSYRGQAASLSIG